VKSHNKVGCGKRTEQELPYAKELQAVLDSTRQSGNVMGVSVAIIAPGYKPWLGVSGESYPGHSIRPDMLFDMGSTGKHPESYSRCSIFYKFSNVWDR
jgi:hypothetical protein